MQTAGSMLRRQRHQLLLIPASVVALWLLVDWTYVTHISPLYSYAGLVNESDLGVGGSWPYIVFALLPLLILPRDLRRPSSVTAWMLYLLLIVPAHAVIPRLNSIDSGSSLRSLAILHLGLVAFVGGLKVLRSVSDAGEGRKPKKSILDTGQFEVLLIGLFLLFNLVVISQLGVRNPLSTAAEIYEVRLSNRGRLTGPSAYMSIWLGKVINPLAIVHGIRTRRYLISAAALSSQVVLFGATGSKSLMFTTAMSLVFIWGVTRGFGLYRNLAAPLVSIVALGAAFHRLGWNLLNVLVVRRELMVPSMLTTRYVEYFSAEGHLYWSRSSISALLPFVPSDPGPSAARLVGFEVFRSVDSHANANFISSGYANAGIVGVVLMAGAAAFFFGTMDRLADVNAPDRNLAAIALMPFLGRSIVQTNLPTALLTHGVLFGLLMLALYPATVSTPRRAEVKAKRAAAHISRGSNA